MDFNLSRILSYRNPETFNWFHFVFYGHNFKATRHADLVHLSTHYFKRFLFIHFYFLDKMYYSHCFTYSLIPKYTKLM